jgi:hypothetical protein
MSATEQQSEVNDRSNSLGTIGALSDDLIIKILNLFSAKELLRVAEISLAFYRFGNLEELWREICFDKWEGNFSFKCNWKHTFYFPRKALREELTKLKPVRAWKTEVLDQKYYRANGPLSEFVSDVQSPEVEIISGDMDLVEFRKRFDKQFPEYGRPVIIRGALNKWSAMNSWKFDQLVARFKNQMFKIGEYNRYGKRIKMKMPDFVDYIKQQHDEEPMYMFDNKFAETAKDLLKDYSVPKLFQEDYFGYMQNHRPDYRWFLIGPARSGTVFHIDPNGTSAWNALIVGRKKWSLYPPDVVPPGVDMSKVDKSGYVQDGSIPSAIKWHHLYYPKLAADKRPIEFTQEEGDLIYVPAGWWHQVLNLSDTVAVTQNVCNAQNFLRVVEMMFDIEDNSGLELFQKLMKNQRADLYKQMTARINSLKAKHLEEEKKKKKSNTNQKSNGAGGRQQTEQKNNSRQRRN